MTKTCDSGYGKGRDWRDRMVVQAGLLSPLVASVKETEVAVVVPMWLWAVCEMGWVEVGTWL